MLAALDSFYPALEARQPLPTWYLPTCLALSVAPFVLRRSAVTTSIVTGLLLGLCLRFPCYTSGDVASDYYNSGPFFALPLWYIDFVLFTPRSGEEAPVFTNADNQVIRYEDLRTTWQRIKWSLRLMLPAQRGVGWNWQVKNVPKDPYAALSTQRRVLLHAFWSLFYYAQSVLMLILLGGLQTLRDGTGLGLVNLIARAGLACAGAVWVWDRLCCAYSIAAAFCIAIRISDAWEWPPLMGSLRDAYNVRQMWSVVYHQALRRMLSRPATYVARQLRLTKGSFLSGFVQTMVVYMISCVYHQLQMYNATRTTTGEFAFFMSQPIAIALEAAVTSLWQRCAFSKHSFFARCIGYTWVILWFAITLQPYINGLVDTEIVSDWFFGKQPMQLGSSIAQFWFKH